MVETNVQHFTAKIVAIQQKMAKNGKPYNAVEFDNEFKLNFFGPFDGQLMDYLDVGWTPGTNPAYPNGKDVKNWIKVKPPISTGNLGIAPTPAPTQLPVVNEAKKGHEENIAMHQEDMANHKEEMAITQQLIIRLKGLEDALDKMSVHLQILGNNMLFLDPTVPKEVKTLVKEKEAAKK